MTSYIVAVYEKGGRPADAEVYELDADSAEQACYAAKDWYINDFHAHDLDPGEDLVAIATPQEGGAVS